MCVESEYTYRCVVCMYLKHGCAIVCMNMSVHGCVWV